jgi:hypothetical protein
MATNSQPPDINPATSSVTLGNIGRNIENSYIAGRDIHIALADPRQKARLRNRKIMLDLVKRFWVQGVLEQSLYGAALIELGFKEQPDAVEHPWESVLQLPDASDARLVPGTSIVDVLATTQGALLILGEPGSGKTTLLLELARDTIQQVEQDPTRPMPVVFNLSSWRGTQTIAEWLVDELNSKYNIPKKIGRPWIKNDELLLLLDGLDEVQDEYREACLRALNDFRQQQLAAMVVCSRRTDYEVLRTPLKLHGAIVLQPLTLEQVDAYLLRAGKALAAVRALLRSDPTLQELVQSPLMLSVVTLAYRGISVEELQALTSLEARRTHLFNTYLHEMFKRRGVSRHYTAAQTAGGLSWLAQQMVRHAQSVFLVEQMQPSWLPNRRQRWIYALTSRSCVFLLSLVVDIALGYVTALHLLVRLLQGGLTGVVDALRFTYMSPPDETTTPRRPRRRDVLGHALPIGLVIGSGEGLLNWITVDNEWVAVTVGLFMAIT